MSKSITESNYPNCPGFKMVVVPTELAPDLPAWFDDSHGRAEFIETTEKGHTFKVPAGAAAHFFGKGLERDVLGCRSSTSRKTRGQTRRDPVKVASGE